MSGIGNYGDSSIVREIGSVSVGDVDDTYFKYITVEPTNIA